MNSDAPVSPASDHREPLAIVGIGCRFPGGSHDVRSFWRLLREGRSAITEVPPDRWNVERFYSSDAGAQGKMVTRQGGFVEHFDEFDAGFFGITPREAVRVDPQQRWLLEVCWEALEDAGCPPGTLRGSDTGVFVGLSSTDYGKLQIDFTEQIDLHTNIGSAPSIAANRLSYQFDFKGPSLAVDTACSSALVAVHLASQSLWSGECSGALAGGVNALFHPNPSIGFTKASMLSPRGQCFSFDARADGYVRAEGAGMIYLQPLSRAIEEGRRIYAVIRSCVLNQDGRTSSMPVPGLDSQKAMLRRALEAAKVPAGRVAFVEAHGTGTPVGDPIEAQALGTVLSENRPAERECPIGSVKTNIGHLESASGIPGLIKAALMLRHGEIPPHPNFITPNPEIPFDRLKLRVPIDREPLPSVDDKPPVVMVNSFGFGGTNACVVLEAAPPPSAPLAGEPGAGGSSPAAEIPEGRPHLLPISARGEPALRAAIGQFRNRLNEEGEGGTPGFPELCRAAAIHREHHEDRIIFLGQSRDEIESTMTAWIDGTEFSESQAVAGNALPEDSARPVFVFTGQGSQWWAMGRQLLDREPVFRKTIEAIDADLAGLASWSLLEELTRDEAQSNIHRTDIAQPAIFALQMGLVALWKSWGIEPAQVIGHSVGEVAAACAAGVYTQAEAVQLVYHRSRLQATAGGKGEGRMVAVGLTPEAGRQRIEALSGAVDLAVINNPNLVTLAGDTGPLEALVATLTAEGIFVRWLPIDYAFHTHQMDPVRDDLLSALAGIRSQPSAIPMMSTVTAEPIAGEALDPQYWWRNVREPVRFGPAIESMIESGARLFVEIGPHPSLRSSIEGCLAARQVSGRVWHSLRRDVDDSMEMARNLAGLHVSGALVDWKVVSPPGTDGGSSGAAIRLPHYPWQRRRFWLESVSSERERLSPVDHPLLGLRIAAPQPTWEVALDPRSFPYLEDHRFWDRLVFPGAAYAEIGLAVARCLSADESRVVEDLEIKRALFFSKNHVPKLRVECEEDGDFSFRIFSQFAGTEPWTLHATGRLAPDPGGDGKPVDLKAIRQSLDGYFAHWDYYEDFKKAGYPFGPAFRQVERIWHRSGEALAEVVIPEDLRPQRQDYHFHPAVLDACFQAFRGALTGLGDPGITDRFFLPAALCRFSLLRDHPPEKFWVHAEVKGVKARSVLADLRVYDVDGEPLATILGFRIDSAPETSPVPENENFYYQFEWIPRRLKGAGVRGGCQFAAPAEVARVVAEETWACADTHTFHDALERFVPELNQVILRFVRNAFLELGWNHAEGTRFTLDGLAAQLGVMERYHRYLRFQLDALASHGWIEQKAEETWEVVRPFEREDARASLEQLRANHPRFAVEGDLYQITAPAIGRVMTGRQTAVDLMFGSETREVTNRYYSQGEISRRHHRLIAEAVGLAIGGLPEHRPLRILEVGAGTGSLTRAVLPVLPADRTEYLFSDVSPAFLAANRSLGHDFPYVEFGAFDLAIMPEAQGRDPHSFDLILAADTLHVAADLRQSLEVLRTSLAPGGLLIFLEVAERTLAPEFGFGLLFSFGLLDDWWNFSGRSVRRYSPLLPRSDWERLLRESGFAEVASFVDCDPESAAIQAGFIASQPEDLAGKKPNPPETRGEGEGDDAESLVFVVFADRGGVAEGLIAELGHRGHRVVRVDAGETFHKLEKNHFTIAPADSAQWTRLVERLWRVDRRVRRAELETDRRVRRAESNAAGTAPRPPSAGASRMIVAHFWCLDHPDESKLTLDSLKRSQQTGVLSLLRLAREIGARDDAPKLYTFTRAVSSGEEDGTPVSRLASAPVTGFLRVARSEHLDIQWTSVELDCRGSRTSEIEDIADELTKGDEESEVAYRGSRRLVRRLQPVRPDDLPARTRDARPPEGPRLPFRLEMDRPGNLSHLALHETVRREPAPGQIEVEVKAVGLNFRDVMKALAIYPGEPEELAQLGDDFSGVVVRIGDGVSGFQPGDAVTGVAVHSFQSFVLASPHLVFHKPESLSHREAATIPSVFSTAYYCLHHLARLQPGESILIHSGTGGVGQAAIQIARDLGLKIHATAGSEAKRQRLREQGIDQVMDSRSLAFAEEIMERTGGRGVDAVLNSLSGEFIPKSFSVLAPFGRFLEIGKVDIFANRKIAMRALQENISYFVLDMARIFEDRPKAAATLLAELREKFVSGSFQPLHRQEFPITEMEAAFRFMAQGKHSGKIVLDFETEDPVSIRSTTDDERFFRHDATCLISGGTSGFGLEVAKWLVKRGVRQIALLSRRGPRTEAAAASLDALRSEGIEVLDLRGDVADPAAVQAAVDRIRASAFPEIAGVFHAAMIVNDAPIAEMTAPDFSETFDPKVLGAWNLHEATRDHSLDHFVCFSSFTAVVGGLRQSSYAAGNGFLDALAHHRRVLGLPALSVNWGPLIGAGYVDRHEKTRNFMENAGIVPFEVNEALAVLSRLLTLDIGQVMAAKVSWRAMPLIAPATARLNLYAPVRDESESGGPSGSLRPLILAAGPRQQRRLIEDCIAAQVAVVTGSPGETVDREKPVTQLGVDSLMAIELLNRMERELGIQFPMGNILNGPTIAELVEPVQQAVLAAAEIENHPEDAEAGETAELVPGERVGILPISPGPSINR